MTDQDLQAAITAAVNTATAPLRAEIAALKAARSMQLTDVRSTGASAASGRPNVDAKKMQMALSILASNADGLPYEPDGSMSLFKLYKYMDERGIDKNRQTAVKSHLYVAGVQFVT